MKVMLDTNILISAFLFKSKIINQLIDGLSKKYEVVICSYTIKELKLLIKTKFKVSNNELLKFLKMFPFTYVKTPFLVKKDLFKIRDEDDYIILYTAIINDIDVFITGDKDFEEVKIDKPLILKPSEFIKKYL